MSHIVPYHLNGGTHSLSYATPNEEGLPNPEGTDRVREYTLPNDTIYCLYTSTNRSSERHAESAEITGSDAPIIYALQQIQQDLQTNTDFTEWKQPEFDSLQKALQTIQWKQSRSEVAADFISSIVLKHPFPNGNHRTSISLAILYLSEVCPSFTIENISGFEDITNKFIIDSKSILTVRRNCVPFYILKNAGATHMERKGGIQIDLSEYDLEVENPYTTYGEVHYNRTCVYITTLLSIAGCQKEGSVNDKGKKRFTGKLRA